MADKKMLIDIDKIYVPDRFRKHSPESVDKMAKNLKARGQFHDIMVTPIPQDSPLRQQGFEYELVEGGLRLAGAKAAGLAQIACLVRENVSDGEKSLIMVEENETRDNLTPLDQGNSYVEAMEKNNWSQEQLAAYLGKSRQYVSQYVVIAKQSDKVKEIATRVAIDISHLEIIMRLGADEAKIAMIERCVKEDLSVKQLENLVNKALLASPDPAGQAEAVKQADGGSDPKSKKAGKGGKGHPGDVSIVKKGEVICLVYYFKDGTPPDDIKQPIADKYQRWLDDEAKVQQSKPDPQAIKAANAEKKANETKIANIKKALKSAIAHDNDLKKAQRDRTASLKEIEDLKAELQALKPARKTGGSANPAPSPLAVEGGDEGMNVDKTKTASLSPQSSPIKGEEANKTAMQGKQLTDSEIEKLIDQMKASGRPMSENDIKLFKLSQKYSGKVPEPTAIRMVTNLANPETDMKEMTVTSGETNTLYIMAMFGDICIPAKDDKTLKWDGKGVEPSSACGNPLSFKATQPGSSGLITATAELPNGNKLACELKIIVKE